MNPFYSETPNQIHDPFAEPMRVIKERGRASAIVLQRELGIGYRRAVAILDHLTAAGKLGPDRADGSREIKA